VNWKSWCVPEWTRFAGDNWLSQIMSLELHDRLHRKQGRSIVRWTLHDPDGNTLTAFLKRHYILPQTDTLLARLFPRRSRSPGWQEFGNLQWAMAQGLPVPRVLAAGETTRGGLQSFIVLEELAGMLALHEAIPHAQNSMNPGDFEAWKRSLVVEIARLSRELHRRRAYHQDLYLCHFYIAEADCRSIPTSWSDRVVMIDFHRLNRSAWSRRYAQVKDLSQLLFSTVGVEGITPRDLVRFRRAYERGDWSGDRPPGRWLDRAIRSKAQRYARHNQKTS
jgi:Lipopolysaccharide kinase (Kdo/WaaP) family